MCHKHIRKKNEIKNKKKKKNCGKNLANKIKE